MREDRRAGTGEQEQMIGAEVEHGGEGPESGSESLPPLSAAPWRGYPADSSVRDIITERRMIGVGVPSGYSVGG
jgi:hypothetical protein